MEQRNAFGTKLGSLNEFRKKCAIRKLRTITVDQYVRKQSTTIAARFYDDVVMRKAIQGWRTYFAENHELIKVDMRVREIHQRSQKQRFLRLWVLQAWRPLSKFQSVRQIHVLAHKLQLKSSYSTWHIEVLKAQDLDSRIEICHNYIERRQK